MNIHALQHPMVLARPAYALSKFASTLYFQLLAQDQSREKLQIVSFNPGPIFNEIWASYGAEKEHFDDGKFAKPGDRTIVTDKVLERLVGGFAVWGASQDAAFLHGRYAFSSWDVEELASGDLRKRLDEDYYFLRGTIAGLDQGRLV